MLFFQKINQQKFKLVPYLSALICFNSFFSITSPLKGGMHLKLSLRQNLLGELLRRGEYLIIATGLKRD